MAVGSNPQKKLSLNKVAFLAFCLQVGTIESRLSLPLPCSQRLLCKDDDGVGLRDLGLCSWVACPDSRPSSLPHAAHLCAKSTFTLKYLYGGLCAENGSLGLLQGAAGTASLFRHLVQADERVGDRQHPGGDASERLEASRYEYNTMPTAI